MNTLSSPSIRGLASSCISFSFNVHPLRKHTVVRLPRKGEQIVVGPHPYHGPSERPGSTAISTSERRMDRRYLREVATLGRPWQRIGENETTLAIVNVHGQALGCQLCPDDFWPALKMTARLSTQSSNHEHLFYFQRMNLKFRLCIFVATDLRVRSADF